MTERRTAPSQPTAHRPVARAHPALQGTRSTATATRRLWEPLLKLRARVSDHVGVLGLRLEVDETEGYAFLRSLPDTDDADGYPASSPGTRCRST